MQFRTLLSVLLLVLMPVMSFAQDAPASAPNAMFVVSVDKANLTEDAVIMGFDVRVQGGSVLVAPLLPKGWEMLIRNFIVQTPPWHSTMNATAEVGAEGVDLTAFQRFLIVEQDADLTKDAPFTVEVGLITTTDGQNFGITWLPDEAISLTPFSIPQ